MRFLNKQEQFFHSHGAGVYFSLAVFLSAVVAVVYYFINQPQGNEENSAFVLVVFFTFCALFVLIAIAGSKLKESLFIKNQGQMISILYEGSLGTPTARFIGSGNLFSKHGPYSLLYVDGDRKIDFTEDLQSGSIFFRLNIKVSVGNVFSNEQFFRMASSSKLNPDRRATVFFNSIVRELLSSSPRWHDFFTPDVVDCLAKEKNLPITRSHLLLLAKSILGETLTAYLSNDKEEIKVSLSLEVDRDSFRV